MELYIFRHGQTVWNAQRRIQGSADIELTDEGRQVAIDTAQAIKDIHFDAVYSSPLKRAYETACILKGDRDLPVICDDRIRELNFGVLEGTSFDNIQSADCDKRFSVFFTRPELYEKPENGESLEAFCARGADFIADITKKHKDDERIMIVAHGAMNKSMLKAIRGLELKDLWYGKLQKNCAAAIVVEKEGRFEVLEDSKVFY